MPPLLRKLAKVSGTDKGVVPPAESQQASRVEMVSAVLGVPQLVSLASWGGLKAPGCAAHSRRAAKTLRAQ